MEPKERSNMQTAEPKERRLQNLDTCISKANVLFEGLEADLTRQLQTAEHTLQDATTLDSSRRQANRTRFICVSLLARLRNASCGSFTDVHRGFEMRTEFEERIRETNLALASGELDLLPTDGLPLTDCSNLSPRLSFEKWIKAKHRLCQLEGNRYSHSLADLTTIWSIHVTEHMATDFRLFASALARHRELIQAMPPQFVQQYEDRYPLPRVFYAGGILERLTAFMTAARLQGPESPMFQVAFAGNGNEPNLDMLENVFRYILPAPSYPYSMDGLPVRHGPRLRINNNTQPGVFVGSLADANTTMSFRVMKRLTRSSVLVEDRQKAAAGYVTGAIQRLFECLQPHCAIVSAAVQRELTSKSPETAEAYEQETTVFLTQVRELTAVPSQTVDDCWDQIGARADLIKKFNVRPVQCTPCEVGRRMMSAWRQRWQAIERMQSIDDLVNELFMFEMGDELMRVDAALHGALESLKSHRGTNVAAIQRVIDIVHHEYFAPQQALQTKLLSVQTEVSNKLAETPFQHAVWLSLTRERAHVMAKVPHLAAFAENLQSVLREYHPAVAHRFLERINIQPDTTISEPLAALRLGGCCEMMMMPRIRRNARVHAFLQAAMTHPEDSGIFQVCLTRDSDGHLCENGNLVDIICHLATSAEDFKVPSYMQYPVISSAAVIDGTLRVHDFPIGSSSDHVVQIVELDISAEEMANADPTSNASGVYSFTQLIPNGYSRKCTNCWGSTGSRQDRGMPICSVCMIMSALYGLTTKYMPNTPMHTIWAQINSAMRVSSDIFYITLFKYLYRLAHDESFTHNYLLSAFRHLCPNKDNFHEYMGTVRSLINSVFSDEHQFQQALGLIKDMASKFDRSGMQPVNFYYCDCGCGC